jgi:hypothetical protein
MRFESVSMAGYRLESKLPGLRLIDSTHRELFVRDYDLDAESFSRLTTVSNESN